MKLLAPYLLAALLGCTVSLAALADDAAPAAAAPAAPAKADPAKGEALYNGSGASCASCHGADGNSSIAANPKLAGQHVTYLEHQLHDFKSGKRKNAIMNAMAKPLSDDDIRNVSAFLASKKIKPGFAKEKDLVSLGEKIYRGGIAESNVPACAGCHSPNGAGIPVQYPRLGGQHAEYVSAQLMAFRDGVRTNNPVMPGVAARMNDREIKAVADYINGLR